MSPAYQPGSRSRGRAVVARRPIGLGRERGIARELDLDAPADRAVRVAFGRRDRRPRRRARPPTRPAGCGPGGSRACVRPGHVAASACARYSASVEKPCARDGDVGMARAAPAAELRGAPRAAGGPRVPQAEVDRVPEFPSRPSGSSQQYLTRTCVVPGGTVERHHHVGAFERRRERALDHLRRRDRVAGTARRQDRGGGVLRDEEQQGDGQAHGRREAAPPRGARQWERSPRRENSPNCGFARRMKSW